jgi:succinate dehydrogenase / fumarate reductase flavoprotein subunit
MGGLWVDYNLMSAIPGLYVLGEANFSDHGANRLGASALMQGLADGYFVIPYTLGDYLGDLSIKPVSTEAKEFEDVENTINDQVKRLLSIKGKKTVLEFHRELGLTMWDKVGMSRNEKGLKEALEIIPELREDFWKNVNVPGDDKYLNKNLEFAGRVADFLELGELMARDALERNESCGGHFREESQTPEGEALRDDENYCNVSVWEYQGDGKKPLLHKEPLEFEYVKLTQRSYK